MFITVVRHTGGFGRAVTFAIKLNGKKVAKLNSEQLVEVALPKEHAILQVSQLGAKSNSVPVHEGDMIEITTLKRTYIFILFAILLSILTSYLPPFIPIFRYELVRIMSYAAIFLVILFNVNWYTLKKYKRSTLL